MSELVISESQAKLGASVLVAVAVMMHMFYSFFPLWIAHRMARERTPPQFRTRSAMIDFWRHLVDYYWKICYFYSCFIATAIFVSSLSECQGVHDILSPLEFLFEIIHEIIFNFSFIVPQIHALTNVIVLVLLVVAKAFKEPLLIMAAIAVYWKLIALAIACDAWNRDQTEYSRLELLTFITSYMVLFLSTVVFKIITFVMVDIFWHLRFGQNLFTKFQLVFDFQENFSVQLYLRSN